MLQRRNAADWRDGDLWEDPLTEPLQRIFKMMMSARWAGGRARPVMPDGIDRELLSIFRM